MAFGIVLSIAGWPALKRLSDYYRQNSEPGRKIFYSSLAYIIAGAFIGFALMSLIFNLAYAGGWFDFTDFGFYTLSLPTSLLLHLDFDNRELGSRLLLYAIEFLNFFVVVYSVDLAVYLVGKIFKSIKNIFFFVFSKRAS